MVLYKDHSITYLPQLLHSSRYIAFFNLWIVYSKHDLQIFFNRFQKRDFKEFKFSCFQQNFGLRDRYKLAIYMLVAFKSLNCCKNNAKRNIIIHLAIWNTFLLVKQWKIKFKNIHGKKNIAKIHCDTFSELKPFNSKMRN